MNILQRNEEKPEVEVICLLTHCRHVFSGILFPHSNNTQVWSLLKPLTGITLVHLFDILASCSFHLFSEW